MLVWLFKFYAHCLTPIFTLKYKNTYLEHQ